MFVWSGYLFNLLLLSKGLFSRVYLLSQILIYGKQAPLMAEMYFAVYSELEEHYVLLKNGTVSVLCHS